MNFKIMNLKRSFNTIKTRKEKQVLDKLKIYSQIIKQKIAKLKRLNHFMERKINFNF